MQTHEENRKIFTEHIHITKILLSNLHKCTNKNPQAFTNNDILHFLYVGVIVGLAAS